MSSSRVRSVSLLACRAHSEQMVTNDPPPLCLGMDGTPNGVFSRSISSWRSFRKKKTKKRKTINQSPRFPSLGSEGGGDVLDHPVKDLEHVMRLTLTSRPLRWSLVHAQWYTPALLRDQKLIFQSFQTFYSATNQEKTTYHVRRCTSQQQPHQPTLNFTVSTSTKNSARLNSSADFYLYFRLSQGLEGSLEQIIDNFASGYLSTVHKMFSQRLFPIRGLSGDVGDIQSASSPAARPHESVRGF
ncbi:hypothetical protein TNCT_733571 [Trichonephila clavata]|uniref:Uncharacterized protein n=1 Tax=Trichonephila clavata TaxID=2740835 RepID=A0A8X6L1W2_TRICU|nr:hypothetical protein TNCT_733571 [Trichonephila clavata]